MHIFSKAWVCIKPSLCLSIGRPGWENGSSAGPGADMSTATFLRVKTAQWYNIAEKSLIVVLHRFTEYARRE